MHDLSRPSPSFWEGFWTGLAGPVGLYEPPHDYGSDIAMLDVRQSFGLIGLYLQSAWQASGAERATVQA